MDSEFEDEEKNLSVKESSRSPIARVRQIFSMFNYITLEKNNARTIQRQKIKTNYRQTNGKIKSPRRTSQAL